ncbi:MAG: hypothetical protein J2P15_20105, partial [Micromonosporaceae bacterium]|nr:hypothetical protein [Micromonosporaceae bacterium]
MATGRPAAAASVLAPLLTGKHRSVTLVAHTATARYFATGAPDAPLLCLCLPEAVRLPCALIADDLPAAGQHPAGSPEQTGRVGGGRLEVAGYTARVARWWRPYRPRGPVR